MAKTTRFLIQTIIIAILVTLIYFFIVSKVQIIQYTNYLEQRNTLYSEYTIYYSSINTDSNLLESDNANTYALIVAQDMLEIDGKLNELQLKPYYPEYTKLLERIDRLRIQMHEAVNSALESQDSLRQYVDDDRYASECISNVNLNGNSSTIISGLSNCITVMQNTKTGVLDLENEGTISLPLTKRYIDKKIQYWSGVIKLYKTEEPISSLSKLENEVTVSKTASEKELNDIVRLSSDMDLDQLIQDITYLQGEINNWIIFND